MPFLRSLKGFMDESYVQPYTECAVKRRARRVVDAITCAPNGRQKFPTVYNAISVYPAVIRLPGARFPVSAVIALARRRAGGGDGGVLDGRGREVAKRWSARGGWSGRQAERRESGGGGGGCREDRGAADV